MYNSNSFSICDFLDPSFLDSRKMYMLTYQKKISLEKLNQKHMLEKAKNSNFHSINFLVFAQLEPE